MTTTDYGPLGPPPEDPLQIPKSQATSVTGSANDSVSTEIFRQGRTLSHISAALYVTNGCLIILTLMACLSFLAAFVNAISQ